SRRRHTRWPRDWSSDVCSSDLQVKEFAEHKEADSALLVHVGPEPSHPRYADREVRLLVLGELLHLTGGHDLLGGRFQLLRLEREIGRASCRERVWVWGGGVAGK